MLINSKPVFLQVENTVHSKILLHRIPVPSPIDVEYKLSASDGTETVPVVSEVCDPVYTWLLLSVHDLYKIVAGQPVNGLVEKLLAQFSNLKIKKEVFKDVARRNSWWPLVTSHYKHGFYSTIIPHHLFQFFMYKYCLSLIVFEEGEELK